MPGLRRGTYADDHRTRVLTILDARGREVPDLDVSASEGERGFVRPHATTPA